MTSTPIHIISPHLSATRPSNYIPTSNRMPFVSGFSVQLMQLLPLLLSLLQQLNQTPKLQRPPTISPSIQSPTFVDKVTFDINYPIPFTHVGAQQTPVVSITYKGNGLEAVYADGNIMGQISEPISADKPLDIYPRINGVRVKKVEYTNTLATYTLENGSVIQSNKPFKVFGESTPIRNPTNPWQA